MTAVLLVLIIAQTIVFTVRGVYQDETIEELKRENFSMRMDITILKEVYKYVSIYLDEGYK